MHILAENDIAQILRQLSRSQCHTFINTLNSALIAVYTDANNLADSTDNGSTTTTTKLIHQPLRTTFTTKDNHVSLFMPVSNTANTGIKIVTVARTGGILGVINIFSPEGRLEALLNAAEITAFRTALAVMSLFVRCPAEMTGNGNGSGGVNVVIFGSGRQAEWHARLVLRLSSSVKTITFINRGRKRLDQMEADVLPSLKEAHPSVEMHLLAQDDTTPEDYDSRLRATLAASDVIFSCTPSTQPNFPYSYLSTAPKRRFIGLIGSYKPHMKEVDTETILSGDGRVYVDSKEACLEESGELIEAGIRGDQLVEVGGLYLEQGEKEVGVLEVPEGCNVVFKCVGMGIMDLAVGLKILDVARERGLGVQVDGF